MCFSLSLPDKNSFLFTNSNCRLNLVVSSSPPLEASPGRLPKKQQPSSGAALVDGSFFISKLQSYRSPST
jgi:hypothetical protein